MWHLFPRDDHLKIESLRLDLYNQKNLKKFQVSSAASPHQIKEKESGLGRAPPWGSRPGSCRPGARGLGCADLGLIFSGFFFLWFFFFFFFFFFWLWLLFCWCCCSVIYGLINRVLETRFPCRCHLEKVPTQTRSKH